MKDSSLNVPLLSEGDYEDAMYHPAIDLLPLPAVETKNENRAHLSDAILDIFEEAKKEEDEVDDGYDENAITQFMSNIQQGSEELEAEEYEAAKSKVEIEVETKEEKKFHPVSGNQVKCSPLIWVGAMGGLSLLAVTIWAWNEYTNNLSVIKNSEMICPGFSFPNHCASKNFSDICTDFLIQNWCSNNEVKDLHFNIGITSTILLAVLLTKS
jgi:hypothetical protein